MTDEILINAVAGENRVAVVSNGTVQEVHVERGHRASHVGDICIGTVRRVLPGMQAAFVDIGLERTGFLHVRDLITPRPAAVSDDQLEVSASTKSAAVPAAAAEPEAPCITELLQSGQTITVQVIKDAIGSKGARLSAQVSIPSRLLVLLPLADNIGVSLRIEDEQERERLRRIMGEHAQQLMPKYFSVAGNEAATGAPPAMGFIARTNAAGASAAELLTDMDYLLRLWRVVYQRQQSMAPGSCIYEELTLPYRTLRDRMHTEVDRVLVDAPDLLSGMRDFAGKFLDGWSDRLYLYQGERAIFDLYGVDEEIDQALQRDVKLKSGGYLIFDQTEAMTTIDVNTGAYVGYRNLEETIFRTNLEAAQAIARQLRLRNLGGIIIIDFIDMHEPEHREQVLQTLARALEPDHAHTVIHDFSPLGLVEMTRKRTTESLVQRICEPCKVCAGSGRVKTADSICYEIFREVTRAVRQFDAPQVIVIAAVGVVEKMLDEYTAVVAEIEDSIHKQIRFQPDDHYLQEQFDVVLK